jgi:hypothetical protein
MLWLLCRCLFYCTNLPDKHHAGTFKQTPFECSWYRLMRPLSIRLTKTQSFQTRVICIRRFGTDKQPYFRVPHGGCFSGPIRTGVQVVTNSHLDRRSWSVLFSITVRSHSVWLLGNTHDCHCLPTWSLPCQFHGESIEHFKAAVEMKLGH